MATGILDITKHRNRVALGWIGGGIAAIATGIGAVVTYAWPAHHGGDINCAYNASIASSGSVSGVTINANGAAPQTNGTAPCGPAPAK